MHTRQKLRMCELSGVDPRNLHVGVRRAVPPATRVPDLTTLGELIARIAVEEETLRVTLSGYPEYRQR